MRTNEPNPCELAAAYCVIALGVALYAACLWKSWSTSYGHHIPPSVKGIR